MAITRAQIPKQVTKPPKKKKTPQLLKKRNKK